MTIFRNVRDNRLYTVTYGIGNLSGHTRFATPYNRAGKGFWIKGRLAWLDFIPVAFR